MKKNRSHDGDLNRNLNDKDENRDPITGAPGSHPVGVGIGAAGGGAAGAALGAAATGAILGAAGGPVGGVVGAVAGAVAGGLAGKGIAEAIDPTAEDAYWRENYQDRPYVEPDSDYTEYQPAYQYGWESAAQTPDKSFDDVDRDLEKNWSNCCGGSTLTWTHARDAVRDAYDRCRNRRATP